MVDEEILSRIAARHGTYLEPEGREESYHVWLRTHDALDLHYATELATDLRRAGARSVRLTSDTSEGWFVSVLIG